MGLVFAALPLLSVVWSGGRLPIGPPPPSNPHALVEWRRERDTRNAKALAHFGYQPSPQMATRSVLLEGGAVPSLMSRGPSDRKWVALTFDDGPFPDATPALLAELDSERVPATFFVEGRRVAAWPSLARAMVARGHELANHSYDHPNLTWLNAAEVRAEYLACSDAVRRATNVEMALCRPPGGDVNPDVVREAAEVGLTTALWTVNTADYKAGTMSDVVRAACVPKGAGTVILLHQGRPNTIAALPAIVGYWRRRGFEFVTLSAMLRLKRSDDPLPGFSREALAPERATNVSGRTTTHK